MKMCVLIGVLFVCAFTGIAPAGVIDRHFSIAAFGDSHNRESRATGLNDRGDVVGWMSVVVPEDGREKDELRHAFAHPSLGGPHDLRPGDERVSEARGVNNRGTIAGWRIVNDTVRATLWEQRGGDSNGGNDGNNPVEIDIDPHGTRSVAYAVNDRGTVTGEAVFSPEIDADSHAFMYCDGELRDIGTLGGTRSVGNAINARGNIAGWSLTGNTANPAERRAFFYSVESGTMHDFMIGTGQSEALGMNDADAVVGWMYDESSRRMEAFVFHDGIMRGLAFPGAVSSVANDINNLGTIVGWYSLDGYNRRAFVTIDGVMTDLTNLVSTVGGGTLAGWTLNDATAINDAGMIVGFGIDPYGLDRGFILTPIIPTPGTLACMVCAGVATITRRR